MSRDRSPDDVVGAGVQVGPAAVAGSRRRRTWVVVAIAAFAVSAVASFGTSRVIVNDERSRALQVFNASSQQVASTLQLEIEHEEDLVADVSAVVADHPGITNAQFQAFATTAHTFARYPEVLDFGFAVIVPASKVASFATASLRDPAGTLGPHNSFVITPPGSRATYCFAAAGATRDAAADSPAGLDYCALPSMSSAARGSEDSGATEYVPFRVGRSSLLSIITPVYRHGVTPGGVVSRRAAFLGWIGTFVSPDVLLQRALVGHPMLAVTFSFNKGAGSTASFSTGRIDAGDATVSTDLHNGWHVWTYTDFARRSVLSYAPALAVLIAGLAFSVTIAFVLLLLSTGRSRALRMVDQRTDELRHLELHDAITGLPNRALVAERAEQLLVRTRRLGSEPSALHLDIDGFKSVNDSLGHAAGDALLLAFAERLRATLRGVDTFGRIAGDEFVILLDGSAPTVQPEVLAERINELARRPFDLAEVPGPVKVTISVGIASGDRRTAEQLFRDADVALYVAKAAGKDRFAVFSDEMDASVQRRCDLEFALRGALEAGEFHLAYQPIYGTEDRAVHSVEALLRWEHPVLGSIGPDEFVPILEESGRIEDVGCWVLEQACHQVAAWRHYAPGLRVAVNVSARQLEESTVVEHVRSALADSGLDSSALTLEVTETSLMRNIDSTAQRLHELKALGPAISIDDFGTGYSSLAYIQRFPVDCLKIDRSFTTAISASPERDLLHILMLLARDLGARTVAEGVESACQLDRLRAEHVDEVQGFLLSPPLSAEQFEAEIIDQFVNTTAEEMSV